MSAKNLLIVESPGKIKTLSKFLGKDFVVEASKGHVIDLPESKIGVEVDNGFIPNYQVVKGKEELIRHLQSVARHCDRIYLAPDPDREGEAISWHLSNLLAVDPYSACRVTFNAITENEVKNAIDNPRPIDLDLVSAQQSRRILDRLVGYKLSPLLWKKVQMGLSAGRVQSVAVWFICQREKEILAFNPEEYWTFKSWLNDEAGHTLETKLVKIDGKKPVVPNQQAAEAILAEIRAVQTLHVGTVGRRERRQTPPPPFITSTLQQEASQRFSFTPKRTMSIAQKLYEGLEVGEEGPVGLITYMRTDSVRIAPEGLAEAKEFIAHRYGPTYILAQPRLYKTKKGAQDAHEAIRPTSAQRTPESLTRYLSAEELKLYTLIWKRFIASQMAEAVFDVLTIDIPVLRYQLQAIGTTLKFDGYSALYTETKVEGIAEESSEESAEEGKQRLPDVVEGQPLTMQRIDPKQNFTAPPPRYSEAMLIKTLEKEGIGRPSTYSTIVDTIQQRGYVKKIEGRFRPSDSAFLSTEILTSCFGDVINPRFTADMETRLDEVEEGQKDWVNILTEFYQPFARDLKKADGELKKVELVSDCICPKCGRQMVVKFGRAGKFLACPGYPECKETENIPEDLLLFASSPDGEVVQLRTVLDRIKAENPPPPIEPSDQICELCGAQMVIRSGRFGRFLACSAYPTCKATKPILQDAGVACPLDGCGGKIVVKRSKRARTFYGCSNYPKCLLTTWSKPTGTLCPTCQAPLIQHTTKKLGDHVKCSNKTCQYKLIPEGVEESGKKA